MKKVLYLLVIFANTNCYYTGDVENPEEILFGDSDDDESKDKIVGGKFITIDEEPYLAQILFYNRQQCGASIISKRWLLTAAHCVLAQGIYNIITGSSYRGKGGQLHEVEKIIRHENYDNTTDENDIALIKVTKPINYTFEQQLILLATEQPKVGDEVTVSGFGKEGDYLPVSAVLKSGLVSVIDQDECEEANAPDPITKGMFCTSTRPDDTCQGDSGGPAVINGRLAGIVSFGYDCGSNENPGVYTRVPNYRKWIISKTKIKFGKLRLRQNHTEI